jgi:hypothetical protein
MAMNRKKRVTGSGRAFPTRSTRSRSRVLQEDSAVAGEEAIGGEIEGDSELGRGTWFRIRLPVAGVEDGPAPHTPASDPGSDAPDADK